MSEKKKSGSDVDPLALQSVYPNADAIFSFHPKPLREILSECLVVLDTNVLLVPYNTGKESLEQIRKTYSLLASQGRLIVPGQVAREFGRHRPEKLRIVFQQLSRKRDVSIKRQAYPLLESVPEYQEVLTQEQELDSQLSEYRKKLDRLLGAIKSWYWDDPVSMLYREIFGAKIISDPEISRQDTEEDLDYRFINKIPPGYKDAGKEDGGIGDLLIWRTILGNTSPFPVWLRGHF